MYERFKVEDLNGNDLYFHWFFENNRSEGIHFVSTSLDFPWDDSVYSKVKSERYIN